VEKTVINRLLDFSGVLDNFEINCTSMFLTMLTMGHLQNMEKVNFFILEDITPLFLKVS
jgi:hypothetical protein